MARPGGRRANGKTTLAAASPRAGRRAPAGANGAVSWLTIRGARHNNLKNIDVSLPLGRFVCVTGVSGSGKSSLINDILYGALARALNGAREIQPGAHDRIEGLQHLDKVIDIDQTPIGRTPRSNPATYIKVFDEIRDLFTKLPDARLRGYKPGRFSFNVAAGAKGGGRCEACEGNGATKIEMDFLADVWVRCPVCEGRRFGRETLQMEYKNRSIADVLEMDVQQALEHFENVPRVRAMLQTLHDVGLDYIKIGQPSTTLSGGEAQRIKLARELVRKPTGKTLYVLDEPTTGLHFDDIRKLLGVLHGFVDGGNTVVVIEHNLDVVKTADWVIDLGPEGGEAGGRVIVEGTPEEVAGCAGSYTGQALKAVLRASSELRVASNELQIGKPKDVGRAQAADAEAQPATRYSLLATDVVRVSGARQHNLRDVTVSFPRNQTTVCTGVSGSGKTSFAIDTVFTEGYRRYVESLSAYARQFLGQMAKPRVDHIEGLSPAICIEQKAASKSPRSTVGTITEVFDYMRVLWARVATPHCPQCGAPVGSQTADEIVARVMALEQATPICILAPVALGDGESYAALFNRLKNSGYLRVRIDGAIQPTAQATTLDARRRHRVEVVVDRTVVRAKSRSRIADSVEHALALGNGVMVLLVEESHHASEPASHEGEESAIGDRGSNEAPDSDSEADAPARNRHADANSRRHGTLSEPEAQARESHADAKNPSREQRFSQNFACAACGNSFEELTPHHFSFNSQIGWCDTCEGLGIQRGAPAGAIVEQPGKSLLGGAIAGWGRIEARSRAGKLLSAVCRHLGVEPGTPLSAWNADQKKALLFGTSGDWIGAGEAFPPAGKTTPAVRFHWRGFFPAIDAATRNSWSFRHRLRNVVADIPCTACRGGRLRPYAAATRLGGRTIVEVCEMPLSQCTMFFAELKLDKRQRQIAGELLKEIRDRLQFLIDVGLDYVTLNRAAPTLSGGEAQRIRLASQIGSGLAGVLYVLDEPTIGLHPRDTGRLVRALAKLRDLGNTLLLVEHDRDVIRNADQIIDFGPRAGGFGGQVVAQGTAAELIEQAMDADAFEGAAERPRSESEISNLKSQIPDSAAALRSLTAGYLAGTIAIPIPSNRRPVEPFDDCVFAARPAKRVRQLTAGSSQPGSGAGHDESSGWLRVRGARQHNLQNIDVCTPLRRLVCITGVSGSGKSSLINDIIWPALAQQLNNATLTPGEHDGIDGIDFLDRVVNVDQSPIGTTPSSNPATYTGVFDWIRELFARLPDSKVRGYNANRFSFNRPGGRCEACEGLGQKRIEMHFMPDVWIECETCRGRRYNAETLDLRFKGKSIADVLDLRVSEALSLFENVPRIKRMLQTLGDVGLDYVQLGQPAPTLSGGEAQRVKLATELGKPETGRTLYMLDEPTTGLHFDDVRKLLAVLQRLVDLGNSVLVVEHNLDVLKCADWIIDLGPEAGDGGGRIVVEGTPEAVANSELRRASEYRPEAQSGGGGQLVTRYSLLFISHTASALAPILAAGPYAERPAYDRVEHARREMAIDRAGLGGVGREVKLPWKVDGRRWHLQQRTSRDGQRVRWESPALEYVEELIHKSGDFAPTNWGERASVEITAAGADEWFFHALTGGEWLLDLYFLVPRGRFNGRELNEALGLKTLDERDDLPIYSGEPRVELRRRMGKLDAVAIKVHDKAEIDTPAFRRFVKDAAREHLEAVASSE